MICYYFNKQSLGITIVLTVDAYLWVGKGGWAFTYFKGNEPEKTNKIGFKVLSVFVFIGIYKDQLFNFISKNKIVFCLFLL